MTRLQTYKEKLEAAKQYSRKLNDRQNTIWQKEIAFKCKHKWQPVQLVMESGDRTMPDLVDGRCYCVCMKCCSHTYIETGWVGFYLTSPDLLEEKYLQECEMPKNANEK